MRHHRHTPAPKPLFPLAVTCRATALVFEGDGRPALYLVTEDHQGQLRPARVPEDARITATLPHPLPTQDKKRRVFLPTGSRVEVHTDSARSVLALHTIRAARELLEALEAYGEARQAWREARQAFEGTGAA